jgi:hypothetical protein
MKKNIGSADRILRIVLAIVIGMLFLTGKITGTAGIAAAVFAAVFLLTASVGTCPLYLPFGINTNKKK